MVLYAAVVAVVAVLALTSMANAGVMAPSRFPLAMSRDSLVSERVTGVSSRSRTPRNAITLTGGLLLGLVAAVAPGYPFVEVVGLVGGLVLSSQTGTAPILGAAGIVLGALGRLLDRTRSVEIGNGASPGRWFRSDTRTKPRPHRARP